MSKFRRPILLTLILGFLSIIPAVLNINQAAALVDTPWGPNRTTFTWSNPAPYATFNSITDNPDNVGDERNFVRIREVKEGSKFGDEVQLEMGKTYEVYIYYHNNADAHEVGQTAIGIADGAAVKSSFPATVKKGERATVTATIFASDTIPLAVWDGAYMTATRDLYLRYVPDTAIIHNGGALNGESIGPDYLFGDGALLGYNKFSGILPGCNQYAGHITYQIFADAPDFTVEKSIIGDSNIINAGDEVTFKIRYQNTGTMDQLGVVVRDTLPEKLVYIPGSTILYNNNFTNGKTVNDDLVTENGMNIGDYAGGSGWAEVVYKAKVSDDVKCGDRLTNSAIISTNDGNKTAKVTMIVKADRCDPHGSIKKTASKARVVPGGEVEFKLTIKNTGETDLTNVTVKDTLPDGLTLVPSSARIFINNLTNGEQISDDLVTTGYTIGNIGTGSTVYITYRAKASDKFGCDGASVKNTATLTYDGSQTSGDNHTASSTIIIRKTDGCDTEDTPDEPHGSIEKVASKARVVPGGEVEFKLTIRNTGETNLANVLVKDALPGGLTLVPGSVSLFINNSDAGEQISDDLVTTGYTISNINVDDIIYITYRAKASDEFGCDGASVKNTATLTYDGGQTSDDHTASVTVIIRKTDGCGSVPPEEEHPTEIVKTGPLEITMAIIVIVAIVGAGGYYWYTHRTLKTVEDKLSGKDTKTPDQK